MKVKQDKLTDSGATITSMPYSTASKFSRKNTPIIRITNKWDSEFRSFLYSLLCIQKNASA